MLTDTLIASLFISVSFRRERFRYRRCTPRRSRSGGDFAGRRRASGGWIAPVDYGLPPG
jgi:hypothetical protein